MQVTTSCMKSILPNVEVRDSLKHHFEEMCVMIVEKRTSVTLIAIRKEFNRKYMVMKKEVFCMLNGILSSGSVAVKLT